MKIKRQLAHFLHRKGRNKNIKIMDEKEIKQENEQENVQTEQTATETQTDNAADNKQETNSSAPKDSNNDTAKESEAKAEETKEPTTEEQLEQLKDRYLRLMAEYDNYRKRTLKEKTDLLLSGSQSTVKAILPVLDDFERAMANQTDDAEAIKKGTELIFNKFNKVLESLGVKKIEAIGAQFDTDMHEAVAMIPAPSDDMKGKVIDCIQNGYTLNDKVIRCAKVAVGQ